MVCAPNIGEQDSRNRLDVYDCEEQKCFVVLCSSLSWFLEGCGGERIAVWIVIGGVVSG